MSLIIYSNQDLEQLEKFLDERSSFSKIKNLNLDNPQNIKYGKLFGEENLKNYYKI